MLRSSVATDKREDWYERQLKGGVEVVICHPKLVETGLDLLAFPTLYFYETGYSLHTLRQASRRSWRIGQRTRGAREVRHLYGHDAGDLPPFDGQAPAANVDAARQTLQTCLRINRLLRAAPRGLSRSAAGRSGEENRARSSTPSWPRLAAGPDAGSFFVLAWRAEAYSGLAAGLDVDGPTVLPEAEKQYRKAIVAFREILDRVAAHADFSPAAEVTIALRIDLARCLRRMSDNVRALSQLLAVLKDHPLMVDAQVEAAYTYQSWGDEKPEYLEMAIQGGKRYQEVWGWGELARRVQSEARFRDVFHEARYNLALCRLRQAQLATDRSQRARLAATAENDILATRRLFPDMGGAVWYDKYNELLKRIQRLADQPAVGLPAP